MPAVPYRILLALSAACLLWSPVARAADDDDLVMLVNGGRLRGVVVEEDPQKGVRIKLLDGQIRSLKPSEVREIQYHGATAPAPAATPTPTPTPAPAPATPPPPYEPSYAAPLPYPPPAPAPAHHAGKFELGLRLGFALPMGDYTGAGTSTDSSGRMTTYTSTAISDVVSLKLPILIELGYEVAPGLVLGVYVQPGIILEKTSDQGCPSGDTCSDHDIELGVQGQYHFARGQAADPWLGLGFGYEVERYSINGRSSGGDKGPQYLKLQGGADFRVADAVSIGPFLSVSLAEYTSYSFSAPAGSSDSQDIPFTALHEWITLGAKGSFRIGP